jgi:hypothetical protein
MSRSSASRTIFVRAAIKIGKNTTSACHTRNAREICDNERYVKTRQGENMKRTPEQEASRKARRMLERTFPKCSCGATLGLYAVENGLPECSRCRDMAEVRNAPAYAELLEWMEEAVEYVNKETRSPSLEDEGRKLLRLAASK